MDEKDKVEARLHQNKIDQTMLTDEQTRLESKLADLDKPKPRTGDVRWKHPKDPIVLMCDDWYNASLKLYSDGKHDKCWAKYPFQFNLFDHIDDLKRNAEDLEEFKVDGLLYGDDILCGITADPNDMIYFAQHDGGKHSAVHATIGQATEFHQKLGRLIDTAKRKQKETENGC